MNLQRDRLMELLDNDESAYRMVLHAFIDACEEIVADLTECAACRQLTAIKDNAHKLKSAARGIGAMELGDACESVEARASEGNFSAAKLELQVLFALCDEVITHIKMLDAHQ